VAIKGKTKRSQGRPGRRPATAPRIQALERRQPWYRAPAFAVTLAVVALLGTLLVAVNRVQEGYARDDTQRFTDSLRGELSPLAGIVGPGTTDKPGFKSAAELKGGKLKPADLAKRADGWYKQLSELQTKVGAISLGEPVPSKLDGNPENKVGGRVPMLSSVRDAYAAAVGTYAAAASIYQQAAEAPAKSPLAERLVNRADETATRGEQSMDAAATQLARLVARYDLDKTRQMPGESARSYADRWQNAPPPPVDQPPLGG
jgi:hypothetical protein